MGLYKQADEYSAKFKKPYQALMAAIMRYDDIVVFRHSHPDFDALGCQLGMTTFLRDNFPQKRIHYVGDNHATFTGRVYPEAESLPLSYYQETKFLGIVLDVGDGERIADPRFKYANYLGKIDHHPCKKEIAKTATICDLEAASCAEIVTDFLLCFKGTKISAEAATYLYSAVVGDSGRFLFSSVSPHTFRMASKLLECGVDIARLYQKMYEKSQISLASLAFALSDYKISPHGVAYYLISDADLKRLGIAVDQGKEHVNTFSNIEGINAWCSITQDVDPKEPCWRISIRSKEKDISGIANKYGGGGHAQASGAKIKDLSELDAFINDLDGLFA